MVCHCLTITYLSPYITEINQKQVIPVLASVNAQKTEDLSPRDIFTTSTMTLLLAAPNRGSEPLYLLSDPIHTDELKVWEVLKMDGFTKENVKEILKYQKENNIVFEGDNGAVFDSAGNETEDSQDADDEELDLTATIQIKGIKWYSGKDFGHAHKWIPTCMYGAVEAAVECLRAMSEPARKFAKMPEENSCFPRHELCPDAPEDQLLTMDETAMALGLDWSEYGDITDIKSRRQWRTSRNQFLKRKGILPKDYQVTLQNLNVILRKDLPKGFPYIPFDKGNGHVKVKWSEALYAGFANCLDAEKSNICTELYIPTINTLNEDLAPTKKKNRTTGELATGVRSVFQRWRHGDLTMTSHQIRHMLDTMAAINGTDAKLTWDRLVDAVAHDYKLSTTRQTLQNQVRIKRAFTEVKALVSGNSPKAVAARNRHLPSSLKVAADQLEKRERTIARLEAENSRLLEQFHTWLYNATQHGITIEQLNEPLETKQEK